MLGDACDAALARTSFVSPDDLTAALQRCNDALTWIECRADGLPAFYGTVCPQDALGLRGYRQASGYQDYGTSIASAYLWWWNNNVVDQDEALAALKAIIQDPSISISAKLYADEVLYEDGK